MKSKQTTIIESCLKDMSHCGLVECKSVFDPKRS